jgi:hypothetical protein
MLRVVADMFMTYVETCLTHYNLRQISEASELISSEALEDWGSISYTTSTHIYTSPRNCETRV